MTIIIHPDPAYLAHLVVWWACASISLVAGHGIGWRIGRTLWRPGHTTGEVDGRGSSGRVAT